MQTTVHEHMERWPTGLVLSATVEMMQLTFQLVARLLFSADIYRYAEGVQHHMGIAIDRIERPTLPDRDWFDRSPLPYFAKFRESADYLAGVAEHFIANPVASGQNGDDLLGLLLYARDDDN